MTTAKPLPLSPTAGSTGLNAGVPGDVAPVVTGAARIAEALRRAIVRCELSPGDRLSETEVSHQFGVSRQPVREAFIRLSVAGLVEARARSGTRVLPVDEAVIRTARFVREAVEVQVVRALVAKGLDASTRDELDRVLSVKASNGLCGVFRPYPWSREAVLKSGALLITWQIQDPGNLGTLIRSSSGLAGGAVLCVGGCRAWSSKVARASAGASSWSRAMVASMGSTTSPVVPAP